MVAGYLGTLGVPLFDDLSHVLTRVAGGALGAIIPAFFSRGVVKRICEFKPPLIDTYVGFTVGSLAAIAWERVVLTVRDYFFPDLGQAIVLGWLFTWSGGLALIIFSVAYFVRDKKRQPIGLGSGVIVTLLTCIVSAPLALGIWLIMAFTFMPKFAS